ncbi:MAG: hypothetical protein KGL39_09045 [Patescibacteria group bacterium]|nr:hypothetical protein [Patescibacteria group bacterium]
MTTRTRIAAAAEAAVHSVWITFCAATAGLLTAAVASGNASTPAHLLAYGKAQWFGYAIANIVAPALRAGVAAKKGTTTP